MSKSYYKKDDPTNVVKILDDSQDAFFKLSNGQMIKKDVFPKYYAEMENVPPPSVNESFKPRKSNTGEIDPSTFFTSSSIVNQNDIMKLKNADPSKGALDNQDRTSVVLNTANQTKDTKPIFNEAARQPLKQPIQNESIVQQVDPLTQPIPNNTNTNVSQYKVYDDEDDAYADFVHNSTNNQAPPPPPAPKQQINEIDQLYEDEKMAYGLEEADRRRNLRLKRTTPIQNTQQQVSQPQQPIQQQMDPSQMMFKTFKRNHDITINVQFTDKIGKPDFIKLMMENMDGDIVGYYKQLILDNIKNNFKLIEDEVEKQIRLEIFGEEKIIEEKSIVDIKSAVEKISKLSKTIIDKSNEIQFNDNLYDEDYLYDLLDNDKSYGIDAKEELEKKNTKEWIKNTQIIGLDLTKEESLINLTKEKLIPGGTTSIGKQLYKYVDERGRTREVLPETALKNGWKPLTQ